MFTANTSTADFATAVDVLRGAGYLVILDPDRRTAQFARLQIGVPGSGRVDIDMAMDWRQAEPVILAVGPVLSLEDAVHSKVSALYGRAAARDFLDVDAIRASGRFTDVELLAAASSRDDGFELAQFATQLDLAQRLRPEMVAEYGTDPDQLEAIKTRFASWASQLRDEPSICEQPGLGGRVVAENRAADRGSGTVRHSALPPPSRTDCGDSGHASGR